VVVATHTAGTAADIAHSIAAVAQRLMVAAVCMVAPERQRPLARGRRGLLLA
jgi:hypothetical protein